MAPSSSTSTPQICGTDADRNNSKQQLEHQQHTTPSSQHPSNRRRRRGVEGNTEEQRHRPRPRPRRRHHPRTLHDTNATTATTTALITCSVCHIVENPPYICPKCRAPYCSIACCRQHKAAAATTCHATVTNPHHHHHQQQQENDNSNGNPITSTTSTCIPNKRQRLIQGVAPQHNHHQRQQQQQHDPDDPEWNITDAMKTAVQQHGPWIASQISNDTTIKSCIAAVINNPDTLSFYKQQHVPFANFIDKILVIAGVLQPSNINSSNNNSNIPLEQWLHHYHTKQEQLTWAYPIRTATKTTKTNDANNQDNSVADDDASSSSSSSRSDTSSSSSSSGISSARSTNHSPASF